MNALVSFSDSPPVVVFSSRRVFLSKPFEVTLGIGVHWMNMRAITKADVCQAVQNAAVYRISDSAQSALGPCFKCSDGKKSRKPITLGPSYTRTPITDPAFPGLSIWRFEDCRSSCSSSRLHFGGKLLVEIVIGEEKIRSPDLETCSKAATGSADSPPSSGNWRDSLLRALSDAKTERLLAAVSPVETTSSTAADPVKSESPSQHTECQKLEATSPTSGKLRCPRETSMCVRVFYAPIKEEQVNALMTEVRNSSATFPGQLGYWWQLSPNGLLASVSWFHTAEQNRKHNEHVLSTISARFASVRLLTICFS